MCRPSVAALPALRLDVRRMDDVSILTFREPCGEEGRTEVNASIRAGLLMLFDLSRLVVCTKARNWIAHPLYQGSHSKREEPSDDWHYATALSRIINGRDPHHLLLRTGYAVDKTKFQAKGPEYAEIAHQSFSVILVVDHTVVLMFSMLAGSMLDIGVLPAHLCAIICGFFRKFVDG